MEHVIQVETAIAIQATVVQIVQLSAQMSAHTMANVLKELVSALPASSVLIVLSLVVAVVMVVARMTHQNASAMEVGVELIALSRSCAQTCCAQAMVHVSTVNVNACLASTGQFVLLWVVGAHLLALPTASVILSVKNVNARLVL